MDTEEGYSVAAKVLSLSRAEQARKLICWLPLGLGLGLGVGAGTYCGAVSDWEARTLQRQVDQSREVEGRSISHHRALSSTFARCGGSSTPMPILLMPCLTLR